MNIFVLDTDPARAAQSQCNKHVNVMTRETAQILCALFEPGTAPYRRTHYNHPCTVWARGSLDNLDWLLQHGYALAAEFTHRYGRVHASRQVIDWCARSTPLLSGVPRGALQPFAQVMPEQYRDADAVVAYRAYYRAEKAYFAKWTRREVPAWFEEDT